MSRCYHATLQSGRDFMFVSEDDHCAATEASLEAALMDDYLVNLEPIYEQEEETVLP